MPKEVIDAAMHGNLVVFAGAGVSTESRTVFQETFYEEVAEELGIRNTENIDFPSLMSLYCEEQNGRRKLLNKIYQRFEYCKQFDGLYRDATDFHRELSSIFSITNIITTNWDDFFERECMAIPFVTGEDFVFFDIDSRKIFKIHGSIGNIGSIIATKEDYNKCYRNLQKGVIGGYLKTLLATKVILFVGFSFSDFDFNRIYSFLKKEMGNVLPHAYIITIDPKMDKRFSRSEMTVIKTSGSFFFRTLREHLEGIKFLFPKSTLQIVWALDSERHKSNKKAIEDFFKEKSVAKVYNLFYQEGIEHAFQYLFHNTKTGKSFNPVGIDKSIRVYESLKKEKKKIGYYHDVAYIDGYLVGLHAMFLNSETDYRPFYYVMGIGPLNTFNEYKSYLKEKKVYHKSAEKLGKRIFKDFLEKKTDLIPIHQPFV